MNPRAWLFILFMIILSFTVAAPVAAWHIWKHKNGDRVARSLCFLLIGICWLGLWLFIAGVFPRPPQPVHWGYAWSFWIGFGGFSISVWQFVLVLFSPVKRIKKRLNGGTAHDRDQR